MLMLLFFAFLKNVGNHFETWNTGVLGPVTLSGLNEGTRDLSRQKWTYQVNNPCCLVSLSFLVIYINCFSVTFHVYILGWSER